MNGTEPLSSAAPSPAPRISEGPEQPRGPSRWTTPVLVAALIVLVLLAIFLPPLVNLGRYKHSITASMSLALGRPVYVRDMQLRLLPTPGIVMTDLTVEEDPAFGYEPALHASSVVATLRMDSLWRGRLEVSSISLDEASINLARNDAGQWNLGSILLRASQIPNAATAERHPGPALRFPYIEATDSRIDFKEGVEKKPFSLMNAEFAMWQAPSGEWRIRLKAQPVRTDLELHLSDTGEITVEGSLRRAASLDSMPVNLTAEWSGAQLGQVSRLLAGFDSGWRGDLDATATLRGPASNLFVQSRLRVADLRRLEFQPGNPVNVDATCKGAYHHAEQTFTGVTCFWPVSPGHFLLTADSVSLAPRSGDLQLELNQIPAEFPAAVLGLMRPWLANVSATGTLNGSFDLNLAQPASLAGHAEAAGVTLSSASHTLHLPALHFVAQPAAPVRPGSHRAPPSRQPVTLSLQPIAIPFGAPQPLVVDAHMSRSGFDIHCTGQASLDRLAAAGSDFGLLGNSIAALTGKGRAELNTTTANSWLAALAGPSPVPATTGTIHIQSAQLGPGFLHAPVQVDSADLFLSPQQISWQNVALHYQGLALRASLQFPAVCDQPLPCPASFTLQSPALDATAIETALTARPNPGLFGQFFSNALGGSKPAPWPPLHGTIQTPSFQLGHLPVRNATAAVSIDGTTLNLSSFDGAALGGVLHGSGTMELQSGIPQWKITAQITGAKVAEAAALFHEHWGSGVLTGDLRLTASGYHMPELMTSATGNFRATWQKGTLGPGAGGQPANVSLALDHFARWTGSGTIAHSTLTLTSSTLEHDGRAYPVSGAITFDRRLALTIRTRKGRVAVSGTLAHPASAAARE